MTPEIMEEFVKQWEPSIKDLLGSIETGLNKAGYVVYGGVFEDYELGSDPATANWYIYTALPGRPEDAEDLDIMLTMTIAEDDETPFYFYPFISITNDQGTIYDDFRFSKPIWISDDRGWARLFGDKEPIIREIVRQVQNYSPKPTKEIWRIHGTDPGGVPLHPSIHTNRELARNEIAERFRNVLDLTTQFLWDLEARGVYSPPNLQDLLKTRSYLDQGKVFTAIRTYDDFIGGLDLRHRELVKAAAGTLDIQIAGGIPWEQVDFD